MIYVDASVKHEARSRAAVEYSTINTVRTADCFLCDGCFLASVNQQGTTDTSDGVLRVLNSTLTRRTFFLHCTSPFMGRDTLHTTHCPYTNEYLRIVSLERCIQLHGSSKHQHCNYIDCRLTAVLAATVVRSLFVDQYLYILVRQQYQIRLLICILLHCCTSHPQHPRPQVEVTRPCKRHTLLSRRQLSQLSRQEVLLMTAKTAL